MEIRPSGTRPGLCTVIDFANAKAARSVGLPAAPHVFQLHDLVACSDGAQGRIVFFRGAFAVIALAGTPVGIRRASALTSLRKLPEGGGAA